MHVVCIVCLKNSLETNRLGIVGVCCFVITELKVLFLFRVTAFLSMWALKSDLTVCDLSQVIYSKPKFPNLLKEG